MSIDLHIITVYRPNNKNEKNVQMYLVPGMAIDFLLKKNVGHTWY